MSLKERKNLEKKNLKKIILIILFMHSLRFSFGSNKVYRKI